MQEKVFASRGTYNKTISVMLTTVRISAKSSIDDTAFLLELFHMSHKAKKKKKKYNGISVFRLKLKVKNKRKKK